jgi:putative heme-binding domain-containing protein
MDTHELWQTAAFVKTLGRVAATPVAGNPRTGEMLYRGKGGCVGCHAIGAEGGRMGPPLHDVGIRRSAAHLKAKLVDPASAIPDSYKLVTIKTRTGQAINGVWLNEDNWSIQLRDTADRFHSLWKKDLSDLKVERRTPMPSYKERLNASELDDIVAYLANQKGMPQ